ncbi:MAG: YcgN family cysteine cluster protein [Zetaproteobacteria bacterium]|nr:MAG: YcgN family cysteine cluster protein [Zetaproteobacteria bacterium]
MSGSFWEKPLSALDDAEWEALCDGCGRCCMQKFVDEDCGEILYTDVACRWLDESTCTCRCYAKRLEHVPGCMDIRLFKSWQYAWLPENCAYRLRYEGRPLPDWHPLLSGDHSSVADAGISMQGCCVSELDVPEDLWPNRIRPDIYRSP